MDVEIIRVDVDVNSVIPALIISAKIAYYYNQESPISISGRIVSQDAKAIAIVSEHQINGEVSVGVKILDKETRDIIYGSGGKYKYFYDVQFISFLSQNAINHIESIREENPEKSVLLNFNFIVKYLVTPSNPESINEVRSHDPLLMVKTRNYNCQFTIKQSDWINKYSHLLGIGNVLLLELQLPDSLNISGAWTDLYSRLSLRVSEMKDAIRHGDWQKTLTKARQFYENLKFDSRFQEQREFKEQLKELFIRDHHSEEGFDEFNKGIVNFFNYASKFIHDTNRTGQLNPVPIPRKEDAYFVYTLAIALLNVIGGKLRTIG